MFRYLSHQMHFDAEKSRAMLIFGFTHKKRANKTNFTRNPINPIEKNAQKNEKSIKTNTHLK